MLNVTKQVKDVALKVNLKQVEVNLYQLKKQVNQLYFSLIFQQEKKALLNSKKELLVAKLKEVKAAVTHGALLPTSDTLIEIELLKIEQQFIELESTKNILFETLPNARGLCHFVLSGGCCP